VLAELPRDAAEDLLARLDRVVPGRIEGFYLVGSASMGAFRPGRSDVDFVAIVDGDFRPAELRRLRALHVGGWVSALIHDTALRRRRPLVCNGVYLKAGDLSRSPLEVTPLAGHVSGRFRAAPRTGFDVNPVTWYVLARHGVALRGPNRDRLQVRTDEAELRAWVLANLNSYWRRWAARIRPAGLSIRGVPPRRLAASGVLGAPRLHYTSRPARSRPRKPQRATPWRCSSRGGTAVIEDAIAYWRGEPPSERSLLSPEAGL
jgi:hypothetical protein